MVILIFIVLPFGKLPYRKSKHDKGKFPFKQRIKVWYLNILMKRHFEKAKFIKIVNLCSGGIFILNGW